MMKNINTELISCLVSITDKAICYANKNDISGISICLKKRRKMLESINAEFSGEDNDMRQKACLEKILLKDRELAFIIKSLQKDAEKKGVLINNMQSLRRRFATSTATMPKFLDKRA